MYADMQFAEQVLLILETLMNVQLALSTIAADHVNLRVGLQIMIETCLT